uniref:Uncharacterized protein n=1 Tax=Rhizophora mucronata TaxID=61149 RepID=A0A2P2R3V2_RHIMU
MTLMSLFDAGRQHLYLCSYISLMPLLYFYPQY